MPDRLGLFGRLTPSPPDPEVVAYLSPGSRGAPWVSHDVREFLPRRGCIGVWAGHLVQPFGVDTGVAAQHPGCAARRWAGIYRPVGAKTEASPRAPSLAPSRKPIAGNSV